MSLLAAQSAWLEAENTEVGDPGTTPVERKRVTSLAPPPAGLDMIVALFKKERETVSLKLSVDETLQRDKSLPLM